MGMLSRSIGILTIIISWVFCQGALAQSPTADNPAFTFFKSGNDVLWPDGAKRIALLIGNTQYKKVGPLPSKPTALPLADLNNSCSDVIMVAEKLHAIGWKREEVALTCEQTSDEIGSALDTLAALPNPDSQNPPIILVYASGHGMQLYKHDYFFGINAHPDSDQAAADAVLTPEKDLFPKDAVDIVERLRFRSGDRLLFPALVVLDDCRDLPFKPKLMNAISNLLQRNKGRNSEKAYALLHEAVVTATGPPRGMLVTYATKDGWTVEDGAPGKHARLAKALVGRLAPALGATQIVIAAIQDIEDENLSLSDQKKQFPTTSGRILLDRNSKDPCLSGCDSPSRSRARFNGNSKIGALNRFGQRFLPIALNNPDPLHSPGPEGLPEFPSEPGPKNELLYHDRDSSAVFTIETFWCSGDAIARTRYDAAHELSLAIRERIELMRASGAASDVRVVRITELPKLLNERPDFQHNSNSVVRALGGTFKGYKVVRNRDGTRNYIGIYFCNGAYTGPPAAVVYVQVPNTLALGQGSKIITALATGLPKANVATSAQVSAGMSPKLTQVRYFSPSWESDASKIADMVKTLTNASKVEIKRRPIGNDGKKANQIQVWIGTEDFNAAENLINR